MEGHLELRIESIRDIEFFSLTTSDINLSQLGIKVEGKDMMADGHSKTVTLTTEVKYVVNYETEDALLVLKYVNEMTFYIDNFEENFSPENGKYIFDKNIARFLLDIITPTIRGILFIKTAGTSLAKCYLPIIPADQLIDNGQQV